MTSSITNRGLVEALERVLRNSNDPKPSPGMEEHSIVRTAMLQDILSALTLEAPQEEREAVARLKLRAEQEARWAGNVQGPAFRGTQWGADIIDEHRQHAADLRLLLSRRTS
jgi:hypothetical protein